MSAGEGLASNVSESKLWDVTRGVWVSQSEAVPTIRPLYILGYGSLIWRPGPLLETLPSFTCSCPGSRRIFAQRSSDHRGTPSFPGLVVTLASDSFVEECGYAKDLEGFNEEMHARVWLAPDDEEVIARLIDILDEREKGGYSRVFVPVKLLEDTPHDKRQNFVSALVYTADRSNPHFFIPSQNVTTRVCDIVSVSVGPSGRNTDYLFNLANYLESNGLSDSVLNALVKRLVGRLGPWAANDEWRRNSRRCSELKLLGWGANEAQQLSSTLGNDIIPRARAFTLAHIKVDGEHVEDGRNRLAWLMAGGAMSAELTAQGLLRVWGRSDAIVDILERKGVEVGRNCQAFDTLLRGVHGACLGQDFVAVLLPGDQIVQIDGRGGAVTARPAFVFSMEDEVVGCEENNGALKVYSSVRSPQKVNKVSAGLKHAAAAVGCNVFAWGDNRYGQCGELIDGVGCWSHPQGLQIVDIACGARHTVAIDSEGGLWSWGDNMHGALGRVTEFRTNRTPGPVQVAEQKSLRWRRVCSGWSHVAARGVRVDGSVAAYVWGRNDLNQCGEISDMRVLPPTSVRIPNDSNSDEEILEVWCGSEFTVAMDSRGELWAAGWAEHGNLSHVEGSRRSAMWRPVVDEQGMRVKLEHPWTEAVACGGAHVICSVEYS